MSADAFKRLASKDWWWVVADTDKAGRKAIGHGKPSRDLTHHPIMIRSRV